MGGNAVSVALLADTHGWLDPRIARIAARCDMAVHAGDVGAAAVLRELRPRTGEVIAIRGNNDVPEKWPEADHRVLETLEPEASVALPGGDLVVIHGDVPGRAADRHDRLRAAYPEARAVVYGHSHRRIADTGEVPWILNPGAAGRTRTYGGPSCLVLVASVAAWSVHEHRFELRSGAGK